MKRTWLAVSLMVLGFAALLAAILGTNLAGMYVIRPLRVLLFVLGAAIIAIALDVASILDIRARSLKYGKRYVHGLHVLMLVAAGTAVLAGYVYFVSLGTWTHWPASTNYYDRLSAAFRSGHLYVKEIPDPALLALPNPYDPNARKGIPGTGAHDPGSAWDMSLYNGKLYPYWGPAPALLLLPIRLVSQVEIGDQQLNVAFLFGTFVFESLILIRIRRRFFPSVPTWTLAALVVLAGFVNPVPSLLFNPRIYDAAIAAGQFFLVAGLYFLFSSLDRSRISTWRLMLSAILYVSAIASRATLAIGIGFIVLMVVWWLVRAHRDDGVRRTTVIHLSAFLLPFIVGGLALAWYNLARFGSVFEFGYRYQLTITDQNKYHNVLLSPGYLAPNLYIYLFNAPALDELFPFVRPVWNQAFITDYESRFHSIYNAEQMIGLVYAAPFLLFSFIPPAAALSQWIRGRRNGTAVTMSSGGLLRWFVVLLAGSAALEAFVVFLVFYGTMRYLLDPTPTLVILSAIGLWLVVEGMKCNRPWLTILVWLALALMLLTVIISTLAGFSSGIPRMRAANPSLLPHARLFFIALARQIARIFAGGG